MSVNTSIFSKISILQQAVITFDTVNVTSGSYYVDPNTGAELPIQNADKLDVTVYFKILNKPVFVQSEGYNPSEQSVVCYCINPKFPFSDLTQIRQDTAPVPLVLIDNKTRNKLNNTSDNTLLKTKGLFQIDRIDVSQFSVVNEVLGQRIYGRILFAGFEQ